MIVQKLLNLPFVKLLSADKVDGGAANDFHPAILFLRLRVAFIYPTGMYSTVLIPLIPRGNDPSRRL